ncbi:serine/arginine repetitive matrix protein 1-like [Pseudopipra pipra]|uniref:serine/arginine repetitive matrix protein 1-like n=1 Tax=Pseudopipra pipra TaxID=415032 RepID=UPI0031395DE3
MVDLCLQVSSENSLVCLQQHPGGTKRSVRQRYNCSKDAEKRAAVFSSKLGYDKFASDAGTKTNEAEHGTCTKGPSSRAEPTQPTGCCWRHSSPKRRQSPAPLGEISTAAPPSPRPAVRSRGTLPGDPRPCRCWAAPRRARQPPHRRSRRTALSCPRRESRPRAAPARCRGRAGPAPRIPRSPGGGTAHKAPAAALPPAGRRDAGAGGTCGARAGRRLSRCRRPSLPLSLPPLRAGGGGARSAPWPRARPVRHGKNRGPTAHAPPAPAPPRPARRRGAALRAPVPR